MLYLSKDSPISSLLAGTLNPIKHSPTILIHFAYPCHWSHKRLGGSCKQQYTCWRRKTTIKGATKRYKLKYNKRTHTNRRKGKPRTSSQVDKKDHTTESYRIPTIEIQHTREIAKRNIRNCRNKQKESSKMVRQRKPLQPKKKEEDSPLKELNEMEISKL